MTDPRLALRELEGADEAAAAELGELDSLYEETEAVRMRALELISFQERLPAERQARAEELADAERELEEAEALAARAAAELEEVERSGDGERVAAARRFAVRARDTRGIAEWHAREARERSDALEAEAARAESEAAELERRPGELARDLGSRARLGTEVGAPAESGLDGVVAWATPTRAALLVARSQVADEREAVIRQANEIGSVVLGEPLASAPPSTVARRVEEAIASR